ncbi:RadC family protein [Oceanibacterium hippocampi]|uniref:MPN domain-containing protein n=1 Tax=Oceanibacterium hippocampi TaxID=745714 RepID=A0A1Y5T5F6_9PROT|nr:DNA repair protein RadC [Oceanibacterium hippocampi]SLN56193.1 hypothetical protein OCH7691_02431 [Oceanibacterium hippocampi]
MPPDAKTPADEASLAGHRARLRERFLTGGPDALLDYELLEMVLYAALPRGDTKALAKRLLAAFDDSFAAVVAADPERLKQVRGVGDATVAAIKTVDAAAGRLLRGRAKGRSVLSSWQAVTDYCRATMGLRSTEQFRILFLDRRNQLIADEDQQRGTVDHTPVYPREVVKRALEIGASAIILVHNHPSGDLTPSRADIEMTRLVKEAAGALGITIHDHVIVGSNGYASFKALGLL